MSAALGLKIWVSTISLISKPRCLTIACQQQKIVEGTGLAGKTMLICSSKFKLSQENCEKPRFLTIAYQQQKVVEGTGLAEKTIFISSLNSFELSQENCEETPSKCWRTQPPSPMES